jgi:hypothetical protein
MIYKELSNSEPACIARSFSIKRSISILLTRLKVLRYCFTKYTFAYCEGLWRGLPADGFPSIGSRGRSSPAERARQPGWLSPGNDKNYGSK